MVKGMWRSVTMTMIVIGLYATTNAQVATPSPDSIVISIQQRPSAEPPGYYDAANGLICATLKSSLSNIISTGVTPRTYNELWTQYLLSDVKPREVGPGVSPTVIWDVYSDRPFAADAYNFTPGLSPGVPGGQQDFGMGGGTEGQYYNREHSVPLSWFGGSTGTPGPATDYFHIFPTDKKVNADRANFIYGVVAVPSNTYTNGGKLGPNTVPGLTGTAFEPIDTYKGDLARAFFYFVTRYQADIPTWETLSPDGNKAFNGSTWPSIESSYLQMMKAWHTLDPVSTKELDRNDAGYFYQGNRNPFIDHPEFVDAVWSSACGVLPVDLLTLTANYQQGFVTLSWDIDHADGLKNFVIERSIDNGISFQRVSTVDWINGINHYTFADNVAGEHGNLQYRIKAVDLNLVYKYSQTVAVKLPALNHQWVIFPNPASDQVYVSFRSINMENLQVMVTDMSGRIIHSEQWKAGQSKYSVDITSIPQGTYIINLLSKQSLTRLTFVVQR